VESHDQAQATQAIPQPLPALCRAAAQYGLPLTIPFGIPTYWSPEAALAIFEFVDEMRDFILAVYATQLEDAARERWQSPPDDRVVIPDDELPF
jgi:hypothetical protein